MQGIYLMSEFGPDTTIIDGDSSGSVIEVFAGVDSTTIIHGFTLRNGAGGLYGGGIECKETAPTISGNTITENSAEDGGGICCTNASPTIAGNTLLENTSNTQGGGIYICYYSSPTITNNIITGNIGNEGGTIHCSNNASPFIDSCTISNNNSDGVYCGYSSNPVIHYNNITNNIGYGICNVDSNVIINAEYNWWGDSTGPYHPNSNQGGLGDSVSDYVDFNPWLFAPWGIEEHQTPRTKSQIPIIKVFPNPFRNKIDIRFQMEDDRCKMGNFPLKIYDASGRLVKSFSLSTFNFSLPFSVVWDGRDNVGNDLPSGVYFIKFKTKQLSETRKLLLIR